MNKTVLSTYGVLLIAAGVLAADKPNIILMMADDLGWGDVAYNGNEIIKTPNLDRMSKEGVRFDRFYAAAPVCSPTRASVMTGRHPYRTGIFYANDGILRPEEITIAEMLKPHGYTTGHFGKWHLGALTKDEKDGHRGGKPEFYNPPNLHGFDTFCSTESKVPTWDPMIEPVNAKKHWYALKEGEESVPYGTSYWSPEGKVTENLKGDDSRVMMDRAIPFIENAVKSDTPFLAVIWFHAPHVPCVAGPEYVALYPDQEMDMQNYMGCISALDTQVGRLRAKLKELGAEENTMVWFCSDNGPEGGETKGDGKTGGFKGRKRDLYEGGVRVPGLLVWPKVVPSPKIIAEPVVTSDYLPTIADAIGIDLPANQVDGVSMLPLLKGEAFTRDPIGFASKGQFTWNGTQYKLYVDEGTTELYDMEKDRFETTDISAQHPEIVEAYKKQWDAWYATCRDSFDGKEYGTASLERIPQSFPQETEDPKKTKKASKSKKTKKSAE